LIPFYPESPIYLLSKEHKFKDGQKIVDKWMLKSRQTLPNDFWKTFKESVNAYNSKTDEQTSYSTFDLFRHRHLAIVTIISTTCTSIVCSVYYGLSYNAATLPGSLYVNNVINGQLIPKFFTFSPRAIKNDIFWPLIYL